MRYIQARHCSYVPPACLLAVMLQCDGEGLPGDMQMGALCHYPMVVECCKHHPYCELRTYCNQPSGKYRPSQGGGGPWTPIRAWHAYQLQCVTTHSDCQMCEKPFSGLRRYRCLQIIARRVACYAAWCAEWLMRMQGVLYSHRSNYLQSFTMSMPDACCLTSATTVLAIVPMVGLPPSLFCH